MGEKREGPEAAAERAMEAGRAGDRTEQWRGSRWGVRERPRDRSQAPQSPSDTWGAAPMWNSLLLPHHKRSSQSYYRVWIPRSDHVQGSLWLPWGEENVEDNSRSREAGEGAQPPGGKALRLAWRLAGCPPSDPRDVW